MAVFCAMTERTDFFSQAYYTIARAIAEAGVNVDLFKTPETIAKSVNRRVRAELKRLAVLLRRLIFLEALQMDLASAASEAAHGQQLLRAEEGMPSIATSSPWCPRHRAHARTS
jgi:hypothetical protein